MYNIPEEVQKIIDDLGGIATIIGSEEALNKLVSGEITYDLPTSVGGMELDFKKFYDVDTGIRYIACNYMPITSNADTIYVLPTEETQLKENNDGEDHPEYFRVETFNQSIRQYGFK